MIWRIILSNNKKKRNWSFDSLSFSLFIEVRPWDTALALKFSGLLKCEEIYIFNLSDWTLHFFNDDPNGLIPTCVSVAITECRSSTVTYVKPNSHFPHRNATTVTLNVGWPVDVYVDTVENDSIYWGWVAALFTVESEIPSFATVCAACDANDTHVHNTKEGPRLQLGEIACL